jgi:predicted acyl esterase
LLADTHVSNVLARLPAGTWHYFAMVPMRDGVRLATDVYVPPGTGSWPCVMMRTAYGRVNNGIATYATRVSNAAGSYAFVVQDPRGDGDSEGAGTFDPFDSENEINDGYDTVEWCATQTWCNGRVGMFGGSGHGLCASMAYLSKAPHLVVVNPGNSAGNTMLAWSFDNGVRRDTYDWSTHRGASIQEWPKPTVRAYDYAHWAALLASAAVDNATVYLGDDGHWNFFNNGNYQFAEAFLTSGVFMLQVKAGTHGTYYGRAFPYKPGVPGFSQPNFFDVLAGRVTPSQSALHYYHLGDAVADLSNGWRGARSWPPPSTPASLYLHADGTASFSAPAAPTGACRYTYDPRDPAPTIGGGFNYSGSNGFLDVSLLSNRADVLWFATDPLTSPVEFSGAPQAELHVSTDVADTLFVVKLVDIYPDGYAGILVENACMARYWQGLDADTAPLQSGLVYKLAFEMKNMSVTFLPGHRIGVLVTSSSTPAFEIHPNTYTLVWSFVQAPVAHQVVHVSSGQTSRVVLPLTVVPEPAAAAAIAVAAVVRARGSGFRSGR